MPEDKRFLQSGIPNAGFAEPMQIRSTNPNCCDAQQGFTPTRNRPRFIMKT
jgi:hypothetical protein